MTRQKKLLLLMAALGLVMLAGGAVALALWKRSQNAAKYLPLLNAAEARHGIPHDLLARMAYQESHFRDDIVSGLVKSAAGGEGILQIVRRFHPTVDPLNVPAAADYAANFLAGLRKRLGSWQLAAAAYNWGEGNIRKHPDPATWPAETRKYIADVFSDINA